MGDSPSVLVQRAWALGSWGVVIGAIMIPILSAVTQWINVKLMPQQPVNNNDQTSSMAASMKTMNMIMPLFSAWMCFSLPSGMGLYWVAGSIIRSIQQVVINKHIDKMDFDEIIQKNSVKSAKKIQKMKETQEKMNAYANMNTRNIQNKASYSSGMSEQEKENAYKNAMSRQKSGIKPGSMMEKANMVKEYNERNSNGNKG